MDFDFSEDQVALREAVARWAEKSHGFERRHAMANAGGQCRTVWAELAELGVAGLAISEANGGLNMGAVEAMVVAEELGRALVSAPFASAAVAAPMLLAHAAHAPASHAGGMPAWPAGVLARMASGVDLVVLAHQEQAARYRLNHVQTVATRQGPGGQWSLTGRKHLVPSGDEAQAFVVPARISGGVSSEAGIGLFYVSRSQAGASAQVAGYRMQDGSRGADLNLQAAPAHLIQAEGFEALEAAADAVIALQCAEAVGLMDKLAALTVEYMNTRKQFGVPLSSFQALRHRVADVKMKLELARSMSYYATLKLGEPRVQRRRAISQARVQLGQSMRFVSQECVQMHGGIGVTDEYLGSHYFKRLTVLEMSFGDTLHHLGEVSARMQPTAGVFA